MIYLLLITGIALIILGWRLMKKEKLQHKGLFQEVMIQEKGDNQEYIKLQSLIYDLKDQLSSMEDKFDSITSIKQEENEDKELEEVQVEKLQEEDLSNEDKKHISSDYSEKLNEIEKMIKENKTVEEMAIELNLGKGEVILLKNLLKK